MNLSFFQQLYASTFRPESLLAECWSAVLYDLDSSLKDWTLMRKRIEENAQNQRKLLKEMFDAFLPSSEEEARQLEAADRQLFVQLMDEYPELLAGNSEKYYWFK